MNLSYFIARRYLFSKRKTNFINIISALSIAAVAFSTAALIIVLSVFNGLEDLLRSLNSSFDPEIKIQSANSKSFEYTPALASKITQIPGVEVVTDVIEDYAYLRYRDANQVVTMKGVGKNFIEQSHWSFNQTSAACNIYTLIAQGCNGYKHPHGQSAFTAIDLMTRRLYSTAGNYYFIVTITHLRPEFFND